MYVLLGSDRGSTIDDGEEAVCDGLIFRGESFLLLGRVLRFLPRDLPSIRSASFLYSTYEYDLRDRCSNLHDVTK